MTQDFNEQFNIEGEKPRFIHKRNPLVTHSWQIFQFHPDKSAYEPVGEYMLIDTTESSELTEKKVINLVSLMNGRKRLVDLSGLTKTRILYNIIPETDDSTQQKIIFREYDGSGVSKENAVLTINKGVFDES